jgi:hypothetical protein
VRLDWGILANSAEVRGNLAYVLGGGIDTVWSPALPAPLNAGLLLRLLAHPSEADRPHTLEVRFLDEDGNEIAQRLTGSFMVAVPDPKPPVGWDMPILFAMTIQNLPLEKFGRYSIEVLADNVHLKSLNLRAAPLPSSTPPGE